MILRTRDIIEQIRQGNVPEGYQKTKDGIFPTDWHTQKMKQWVALAERPGTLEDDKRYRLVTVRRGFGGVDLRGEYLGKDILVKNYFRVRQGDFLISKRQIAHGACGVVPESLDGAVVSNEYNVFVPNQGTNIEMFNLMMQLPHYTRLFHLMSDGVHIEKLLFKTQDWMRRQLAMPPIEEQQKIAAILTTQDKVIELKEKRLAEKQRQKKYLMQQLLTGKKRLLGFSGTWKKEILGKCASMCSGGTPDTKNEKYYGNDYIWISIKDMTSAGKYICSSERGLTEAGILNCSARLFPKGTILFAMYASIGVCSIAEAECCSSQAILGIEPDSKLNNEFLYYLLSNSKGYFKSFRQASSQPNLNKGIVQSIVVQIPEIEEQAAIVEVLSAADREIDLLRQDIEQEKQKKKALMQMLLTGIVRVKV
ncbi:restriction endonuclease subunit S [Bacilliculturomica massiliensis]|uniref:restriction endonuclease subunit S n=1 Tax=Bacilliculturomica massiliensis TaxID=1917867 RepID=UPI00102FEA78|nr:restriction endonuclease subunit S [Bacilliculturomica massiliensis]